MSGSSFTPGPWAVGTPRRGGELIVGVRDHAPSNGPTVARVFKTDSSEANARLIAAAPELLAAAYFAEVILSPAMSDHRCTEFGDWSAERGNQDHGTDQRCNECNGCGRRLAWTMLTPAIAKARGEIR